MLSSGYARGLQVQSRGPLHQLSVRGRPWRPKLSSNGYFSLLSLFGVLIEFGRPRVAKNGNCRWAGRGVYWVSLCLGVSAPPFSST